MTKFTQETLIQLARSTRVPIVPIVPITRAPNMFPEGSLDTRTRGVLFIYSSLEVMKGVSMKTTPTVGPGVGVFLVQIRETYLSHSMKGHHKVCARKNNL